MFPVINTIDDVLPYIAGRSEFAIKAQPDYTSIDYNYAEKDTFDCPVRRECRGIKFDKSGKLIARPYHKFFNLGEKEETQSHNVNFRQPHVVLDKLDGSMVHPALVNDKVLWMTRAGVTSISEDAGRYAEANDYVPLCRKLLEAGLTPIFEWCSPGNQIVVRYPEDMLILTGIRVNKFGNYVNLGQWHASVLAQNSVATKSRGILDIGYFETAIRVQTEGEGVVIRFDSGMMIKIKADAYVLRHKARDTVTLEKNVLKLVLTNAVDDVLSLLPADEADRLLKYQHTVNRHLLEIAEHMKSVADNGRIVVDGDRKRFALEVVPRLPHELRGVAFVVFTGTDAFMAVKNVVLKNTGSINDIDKIRWMLGGAKW